MHPIVPRDCLADFVDRTAEKEAVDDFCHGRLGDIKRCLIFHGQRDVGTTFFLQHIEQGYKDKTFTVYADCRSSDPEVIFRSFFAQLEQRPLLRRFSLSPSKEIGTVVLQVIGAFLSYIPIWGRPVGIAVGTTLPGMAFTPYSSVSSERFSKLVRSGRWKRPVLFLVDNVQEIKPQSLNILRTVFSDDYRHVRFVLCFVDGDPDGKVKLEEFQTRLVAMGIDVETRSFPPPDDFFLKELATTIPTNLTQEQRQSILKQAENKVSRIIKVLWEGERNATAGFSPIETELLRYLVVAAQPLQQADLIALTVRSSRIAGSPKDCQAAMDKLVANGWLAALPGYGVRSLEPSASAISRIREAITNSAFDIVAAQELYRYFCDVQDRRSVRHAASAYGALLYRLARQLDPTSVQQRAFDLVRISLGQGDLEAARQYVLDAVAAEAHSAPDLYTLLAFHVSVQEYTQAADILQALELMRSSDRTFRVIHAVVENRLRRHAIANQEIDLLLAEGASEEERALLLSYKVAGLLHDERFQEAVLAFESNEEKFRHARNRAYALRNCAAAFFWEPTRDIRRAESMLDEAMSLFERQRDEFGYLTTLNNKGALARCSIDFDPRGHALLAFQEAFNGLSVYGVHHLEEAGTNLGICLFLGGEYDKATRHLNKMLDIASFDFPCVLIQSALAFAEAIGGDVSGARARMAQLVGDVWKVNLKEPVFRAKVNAAALEAMVGDGVRFDEYVRSVSICEYSERSSLYRVIHGAKTGNITPKTLPAYFSYDFFQYWSQNPLTLYSPSTLTH